MMSHHRYKNLRYGVGGKWHASIVLLDSKNFAPLAGGWPVFGKQTKALGLFWRRIKVFFNFPAQG